MSRSLRALALASASGLAAASALLAPPALAACITVVTTTTCTGTSGGGAIGFGPVVTNGNTVINLGTLTGTTDGIQVNDGPNVVQNAGTISGGATGIDFVSGSGSTVSNDGTVIGGTTAISMSEGNAHTLTNNGSIIATGAVSTGIFMLGISGTFATGSSIVNNGTVTAGTAIDAGLNGGAVTNNGTLTATDVAIRVAGPGNAITNNGTITAARGILVLQAGNTATNNGRITASNVGIDVTSNVNSVTNTGTITAPIGIRTNGATNTIVNSGLITAAGGIGVSLTGDTSPLTNNGTITSVDAVSGLVGVAVSTTGAATVTNNGVLNGGLSIGGPLINNGLITISVPGTNTTHTAATFQQTAAGTLVLRADIAGNHDTLQVAGTATLGGTLLLNLTPRFFNSQVVFANVVTATTFNGTQFATVSLTLPSSPFIRMTTAYASPTGVVTVGASSGAGLAAIDDAVSVILTPLSFGGVPGLTINQREVGGGLDRGCAGPLSGAGNALCANVLFAPSVNVLDTLSGEVFTGVQNPTFTIGDQFLDAMLAQVQRRRGQPCGSGQSTGGGSGRSGRFGAWASGFGTLSGHRDGDPTLGSARLNASDGGAAAGGDMCLGPNLRIGFAFGGASSEFTLDGRTQGGNTRAGLAGTYGSWASGPFYVDLALAYGHSDFSTTRNIALNAITERATADFTGNQFASRLEAGFHMRFGGYSFIPFIGATGQVLRQNGASESSVNTATGQPGIFGLNTQAHTSYAPLPTLGASASKTFEIGETTTITPRLRVSWGYETSADRQSSSSFQALSGASFTVNGARPARSGLNLRAGVDGDLFGLIEFYAQVDSAIAAGGNGFSAAAGLRMAW